MFHVSFAGDVIQRGLRGTIRSIWKRPDLHLANASGRATHSNKFGTLSQKRQNSLKQQDGTAHVDCDMLYYFRWRNSGHCQLSIQDAGVGNDNLETRDFMN